MKRVKVTIQDVLDAQDRTVYSLAKKTGISQNNLAKIVKNETKSIKFDILEKICDELGVGIADVLVLEDVDEQISLVELL